MTTVAHSGSAKGEYRTEIYCQFKIFVVNFYNCYIHSILNYTTIDV